LLGEPDTAGRGGATEPQLVLRVVAGPASGTVVEVGGDGATLGRGQEGTFALGGDAELSRKHAHVSALGDKLLIEDLGSTNGTFVNGGRVAGPTVLGSGDAVWMGTTTLLVQHRGEPSPAVAPVEPPAPSAQAGILSLIADVSVRYPKRILGGLAVLLVIGIAFGGQAPKIFKDNSGFDDPSSEYIRAQKTIAADQGFFPVPMVVLVQPGRDVTDPRVKTQVARIAGVLARDKSVDHVITAFNAPSPFPDPFLISRNGRATQLLAFFKNVGQTAREESGKRLRDQLEQPPQVMFGGQAVSLEELRTQVRDDLGKAEMIGFPILFLLSLFVFRGLIAAVLPLVVGIITVFVTFLVLRILNGTLLNVNVFALNVVIGLGLGLAIDYSLFVVSRYREELVRVGRGRPDNVGFGAVHSGVEAVGTSHFAGSEQEALRRTMMTAGRTILFSAFTVAVALAALTVFPQPVMYSMGLGGAIVAVVAVLIALVALPALLALLGGRINSVAPRRWREAAMRTASAEQAGFWYRLSQAVMRRPATVALASAALLLAVGFAFTRIHFTGVTSETLPTNLTAKKVDQATREQFSSLESSDLNILIDAPPAAKGKVEAFANRLQSSYNIATVRPPTLLEHDHWLLVARPWTAGLSHPTTSLVRDLRREAAPFPIQISGESASFVDQRTSFNDHLPLALAILMTTTLIVLFVMTGSIVLPVKSLLMNLLTISASLGFLVLIFQDGRLEKLLGYSSLGAIDSTQPILISAMAFGLSTDYAVFLLTRINEARLSGLSNRDAVAAGLERTGRIVTQAALLFCVAIGAFATSKVIFIKELGLGIALAVIIDATIIRALLVPSLMALLGDRNWWAPGPLRRLHNRIGLSEG
jgi:uncharacterized membrane protein YdfJ with MMPL/SSD domain